MDEWTTILIIVGMTAITVVTRSFFFITNRPWVLPRWARRGLQFAPVAALAAVIAPEVLLTDGHALETWRDARLFAVGAGVAWYGARGGVLGTIVAGMLVYLPLHLLAGW